MPWNISGKSHCLYKHGISFLVPWVMPNHCAKMDMYTLTGLDNNSGERITTKLSHLLVSSVRIASCLNGSPSKKSRSPSHTCKEQLSDKTMSLLYRLFYGICTLNPNSSTFLINSFANPRSSSANKTKASYCWSGRPFPARMTSSIVKQLGFTNSAMGVSIYCCWSPSSCSGCLSRYLNASATEMERIALFSCTLFC